MKNPYKSTCIPCNPTVTRPTEEKTLINQRVSRVTRVTSQNGELKSEICKAAFRRARAIMAVTMGVYPGTRYLSTKVSELRHHLPYVWWTDGGDGLVLCGREYQPLQDMPICRIASMEDIPGTVTKMGNNKGQVVKDGNWFFSDRTAPWNGRGNATRYLKLIESYLGGIHTIDVNSNYSWDDWRIMARGSLQKKYWPFFWDAINHMVDLEAEITRGWV